MTFIFFILAAIMNSIMDISSHNFHQSIFKKLNPWWWNGELSWKNKYIERNVNNGRRILFQFNIKRKRITIKVPVQITDAFHFFKMWMIIFLSLSVVTYNQTFNPIIDVLLLGTCWNVTFSLFYHKFLRH